MSVNIDHDVFNFFELEWDTEFFGVSSAKAVLNRPLSIEVWDSLKNKFKNFQFISIVNKNSDPVNAQIIGKNTSAFLADINIQFKKKVEHSEGIPVNTSIHRALKRNNQIIDLANFHYSKFTEDSELQKRNGEKVYHQWIINSFNNKDKYYALHRNYMGQINGFLLYSYTENSCVIELIAVSKEITKGGIGTSLFKAIEHEVYQHGIDEIRVGTQVRNTEAINFYHKVGCKQMGCHQVYHLWNV